MGSAAPHAQLPTILFTPETRMAPKPVKVWVKSQTAGSGQGFWGSGPQAMTDSRFWENAPVKGVPRTVKIIK